MERINYTISFLPWMANTSKNSNDNHNCYDAQTDTYEFVPQDISLKDDAYHGSTGLQFAEWWYFDATLNDGYSIQFSTRILSGLHLSFMFVRFDVYKDGHLVSHKKQMHLLKDVDLSKEQPLIKIGKKTEIKGYPDKKTGNFIYDIFIEMDGFTADLHFTGVTKGWKGKHEADDWWAVVLPRASVHGTITIQNKTIAVQGWGYHDHNWNVKMFALKNVGWYWGKIYSNQTAITWAKILRTAILFQPMLIINVLKNGYISISPKDLQITATDISDEKGKMIPHVFQLDAQTSAVSLHVTMKTVDIHHEKIFPLMNYFRYHVRCTGSITIESNKESIDDLYIAEFLKFR